MKTDQQKNVLITFARSFLSLQMARLWRAAGHRVFVVDSNLSHVSHFSNAVYKSFALPSPRFQPEQYVKGLIQIIKNEKIDVLIPMWEDVSYLSKAVQYFPSFCTVFCPPFDLYHQLQNKWLFHNTLQNLSIDALPAYPIYSLNDLQQLSFSTPFALKPFYSRASQKVRKVNPGHFPWQLEINPNNPWIAQEWAEGNKFCTYSVCHSGCLYAHAAYPVSYAIDGNSCLIFEAIDHAPILKWITHFVRLTNFTGQIAFDFIETGSKKLYAIECNPRATSGLLLFKKHNQLERAFLKSNAQPIFADTGMRQQIAAGMLLYGWRKSAMPNRRVRDFLKDFLTTQDVVFRLDDIRPFLAEPFIFGNMWLKSKKIGLSIPGYFTHDHEWNGEPLDSINPIILGLK